jgi:hypothetical protein
MFGAVVQVYQPVIVIKKLNETGRNVPIPWLGNQKL